MFNKTLLKQNSSKTNAKKQEFLSSLDTKTLANQQSDLCKNEIRETDLSGFMKSVKNDKTPGNDGWTKELYVTFWDKLKTTLMESIIQAFYTKILSIPGREALMKLVEKKDRDK